jgi:hypothetical protein
VLRRDTPALRQLDLSSVETHADDAASVLLVRRGSGREQVLVAFNFSDGEQTASLPGEDSTWRLLLEGGGRIDGKGRITLPPAAFGVWGR